MIERLWERGHTVETSSLVEMISELPDKAVPVWHSSCSTEYVRGVRPVRLEIRPVAFIADRNGSFLLQEVR